MGQLIEGECSSFEEAWLNHCRSLKTSDLLSHLVCKDDAAFQRLEKVLEGGVSWDGTPPKLVSQKKDELKTKIAAFSDADTAKDMVDILFAYQTLDDLANNKISVDELNANTVMKRILDFANYMLEHNESLWASQVPPLIEKAESLLNKIGGRLKGGLEVKLYNTAGSYEWKHGKYEVADALHCKALDIARKIKEEGWKLPGDGIFIARTYRLLGRLHGDWKESPKTADDYANLAINILEWGLKTEEPKDCEVKEYYGKIPSDRLREAKIELSKLFNDKGVRLSKTAEDCKMAGDSENYIKTLEEARRTYQQSIRYADEANNSNIMGWASFNLAENLAYLAVAKHNDLKEGRLEKKLKIIEKARSLVSSSRNIYTQRCPSVRGNTGSNMAGGVVSMCEGDIYKAENNNFKAAECWRDALKWHDISVKLRRQLGEDRRTADGLVGRADVYMRLGETEKYTADLNEALGLYEKIYSAHNIAKVKKMLGA